MVNYYDEYDSDEVDIESIDDYDYGGPEDPDCGDECCDW